MKKILYIILCFLAFVPSIVFASEKELNIEDPFIIGGFIRGTTLTIYTTNLKILFDNIDVMNRYFNRIKSIPAFVGITDLHFDKILPYII